MSHDGWVCAMGVCWSCKKTFMFNPHKVPSFTPPGGDSREPICSACMTRVNEKRKGQGLDQHPILPGAYEPMPEEEF